ncbi:mandelate racemase/muconate lactonizing enzyme family protein [Actinacidiphila sp. ITFR-21]|uniref:mandelate racemase/muconate lactonizing enzyme family protein n=1 Tax=Actinacidiphila sp. ITFR-21 TaxID=3075199 RepID=UPI0028893F47|nr:enolase C-terminal domain-like protein [Streptomyces sp. ITFR-21]WNI16057.1 enolase C-terminal domain-like protein [Streptomyces sp. ITFR-21]
MDEARLHHVTLPMLVGFDHPAARRRTSDSLVLELTVDGVTGLGECAPRRYVTGETTESVRAELAGVPMDRLLERLRTADPADLLVRLRARGFAATFGVTGGNNLRCLLETAVLDLIGRRLGFDVADLLPEGVPGQGPLPVSQVLDLGLPVEEFLATRGPFHQVKVKAAEDPRRDLRTVGALRAALGPDVPVLVDANMSWTLETATGHVKALRDLGVDLVEEPLRKNALDELRELRRATGVSVMLDESLCSLRDAEAAVLADSCDAFNVRVSKCGGLLESAAVVDFARRHGVAFQIGVQVAECGPLISAGRALAFRNRDAFTVEAGQSDRFFAHMIVSPAPAVDRAANTIAPAGGPGLGLVLDEAAARFAVAWPTRTGEPPRRTGTPEAAV